MRKLFIAIGCFASLSIAAQESSSIITDRPTQSAAASVMPEGNWLIEYGTLSERTDADNSSLTFANFLVRYGIADGFELRLTQDFLRQQNTINDLSDTGFSPLTIGTKVRLLNGNGWLPMMSAIVQVTVPSGNDAFNPTRATPEVRLNFSNALSERFSLGYNLGMRFPEEGSSSFYTAVLGYSLPSGWTLFAEPYGFFGNGISDQRFNTGVIYLINHNFQVDISAGWGLSDISPKSFVGFGLAYGF